MKLFDRHLTPGTAPFVDGASSNAPLIRALNVLPAVSINQWSKLASFFVLQASGTIEASSGVLSRLTTALTPGNSEPSEQEKNFKIIDRDYGLSFDTQMELKNLTGKRMFSEETVGANSEALNCLKKGPEGSWGEADDLTGLVNKLAVRQREQQQQEQDPQLKLSVMIYLAETDVMTGKTGQEYFRSCWTKEGEGYEDSLDVKITTIEESDHDSVIQSAEALKEVFKSSSSLNRYRQSG